ncbi:hypothetical protein ABZ923_32875 [Streptomyces sp. NPDC046881]|uniref:hypothetical protein n=1 Tax=Streptomyces sp. NPDC046881 TaxID=3155374 RepID=UPI0033D01C20
MLRQRGLDAAQPVEHRGPRLLQLLPGGEVAQPVRVVECSGQLPLPLRRPGAVLAPPYLAAHRLPRRAPASFPHHARHGGWSTTDRTG